MLKEILEAFFNIKENWREWKSVFTVVILLTAAYFGLVIKFERLRTVVGIISLAVICIGVLAAYIFLCALHGVHKREQELEASGTPCKKKKKKAILIIGICVSVLIVAMGVCQLILGIVDRDGEYVIWVEDYNYAMTHVPVNVFYLDDAKVTVQARELVDYPGKCVFELDFKRGNTFTISYGGKLYGTVPGTEGGVGCNSNQTCTLWELEGGENGVYRIKNVDTGKYLQWYKTKRNWTCKAVVEEYADQYNMCIQKLD